MVMEPLEKLADAPIDEVVCGVVFEPLPALDPVFIGKYLTSRASDFSGHELRPAVFEGVSVGVPLLRALLAFKDEQFVIQLQHDRFYFNWRKRSGGYPRFTTRDGKPGVLGLALDEFERLAKYCLGALNLRPNPKLLELVKVDLIKEGRYWSGLQDLAAALPCLRDLATFATSPSPAIALAFEEPRLGGTLSLSVVLGSETNPPARALRIESRMRLPCAQDATRETMAAVFTEANQELNALFGTLIPRAERAKRFSGRGSTG